jgi:hypothetical protein
MQNGMKLFYKKERELIKMLAKKNPNKKAKREYNKQNRVLVPFNTGTRSHKDKRKYNRNDEKKALRNLS